DGPPCAHVRRRPRLPRPRDLRGRRVPGAAPPLPPRRAAPRAVRRGRGVGPHRRVAGTAHAPRGGDRGGGRRGGGGLPGARSPAPPVRTPPGRRRSRAARRPVPAAPGQPVLLVRLRPPLPGGPGGRSP